MASSIARFDCASRRVFSERHVRHPRFSYSPQERALEASSMSARAMSMSSSSFASQQGKP